MTRHQFEFAHYVVEYLYSFIEGGFCPEELEGFLKTINELDEASSLYLSGLDIYEMLKKPFDIIRKKLNRDIKRNSETIKYFSDRQYDELTVMLKECFEHLDEFWEEARGKVWKSWLYIPKTRNYTSFNDCLYFNCEEENYYDRIAYLTRSRDSMYDVLMYPSEQGKKNRYFIICPEGDFYDLTERYPEEPRYIYLNELDELIVNQVKKQRNNPALSEDSIRGIACETVLDELICKAEKERIDFEAKLGYRTRIYDYYR